MSTRKCGQSILFFSNLRRKIFRIIFTHFSLSVTNSPDSTRFTISEQSILLTFTPFFSTPESRTYFKRLVLRQTECVARTATPPVFVTDAAFASGGKTPMVFLPGSLPSSRVGVFDPTIIISGLNFSSSIAIRSMTYFQNKTDSCQILHRHGPWQETSKRTGKVREALKPQGALKPRIQNAINKLQVQIFRMDTMLGKLQTR